MNAVAKFFASGFGTGYSPVAPGTAGSLLASAALFGLNHVGVDVNPISLVIATVITTIAGVIATNAVEDEWVKIHPN